jgi:hypothetical protein
MNLSKDVKITLVQPPLADGQTDPDSAAVDMQGFEGVMFVGILGTVTADGTACLKASQSSEFLKSEDTGVEYQQSKLVER